MNRFLPFQLFILLFAAVSPAFAGETGGELVSPPLPDRWQYTEAASQPLPADDAWWREFNDPVLDSLIVMGEEANYDVAMALHRMAAADRQIAVARAAYFPTIGLQGGYTRSRQEGVNLNTYTATATASWQVDIFGKVTAAVRQKKAAYRASRAEWAGTQVSMAAQIASTYMQLRSWQAQLAVAEAHISRQDTVATMARARFECGLAPRTDVDQAEMILYSTRATVPTLRSSIRSAINSLGLLTGRYASEIEALLASRSGLPDWRRLLSTGVPADLLRRRPDVVEAEQNVAAAAAAVGIAKKDFLPTLTIDGSVGLESHGHGKFFSGDNLVYSVGPTLSWTVFDGLARRANVAIAREDYEALVEQYRYTVMNAVDEVDNALTSYTEAVRSIADYERADHAAAEFLTRALDLYTQGLSDFTSVADAQISYLQYNNSLISARANALAALVDLYRALGGGYSSDLQ